MPASTVYIGLGANLGNPERNVRDAIHRFNGPAAKAIRRAPVYASAPLGPPGQPEYVNTVLQAETSLEPPDLLVWLKRIEREMGRQAGERWGPRLIDLDILLYGHRIVDSETLRIPHPEMTNRGFVLAPLADLAPDLVPPGQPSDVRALLDRVGRGGLRIIESGILEYQRP